MVTGSAFSMSSRRMFEPVTVKASSLTTSPLPFVLPGSGEFAVADVVWAESDANERTSAKEAQ